uniref:Lipid-binding serum glycoprotein C-terminal domain-containing protein n=1 Tax=Kalanchoe fedtschenkoi TaxID=63787 RepID=A0A7N0TB78_KALFE
MWCWQLHTASMAQQRKTTTIFIFIFISLLVLYRAGPSQAIAEARQDDPSDQAFISLLISTKGLDFVKDLLITQAVSSLTPLQLPNIENSAKIPVVGEVHIQLSNITIYHFDVTRSHVKPGDTGIAIIAYGAACNMSMNWFYSYSTWLVPIKISDKGSASVQVTGIDVGLTLGLENKDGSLKLSLLDSGCYVKDISIKVDGGASWLYQGMIDAFEGKIRSSIENEISQKLNNGILKLDSVLQSLPREIPVDDDASLNVTFIDQPKLSKSFIWFKIDGLFTPNIEFRCLSNDFQLLDSLTDTSKMLGISLEDVVFNSASAVYYNAGQMHWKIDNLPDQSLLNTAGWRLLIPQLYKKYPDDDMIINISLTSAPVIKISQHNMESTIFADLVIDVLDSGDEIPVACISLVIHGSGTVRIFRNNLAGSIKLSDFTMDLQWSDIGKLRMHLIQPVVWTLLETIAVPYANLHLAKGFPLPIINGFTLKNANIILSESKITVYSDVSYDAKSVLFNQFMDKIYRWKRMTSHQYEGNGGQLFFM